MPLTYTDPVSTYSDAAFTALEKERIREILGLEALSTLDTPISELTADQRKATRYDIDQWINEIGEGTVSVHGASNGTDFSTTRDRNAIRQRVARRFGFSVPATGGLFRIPVIGDHLECYD
jgi:hypothetical protein